MLGTQKSAQEVAEEDGRPTRAGKPGYGQLLRFCIAGGINTVLDVLALNALQWLFPTRLTWLLLLYNVFAYGLGACNSFLLNKYWTFRKVNDKATWGEFARFSTTTMLGMAGNTTLFWLVCLIPHPLIRSAALWTNIAKVAAIAISAGGSYLCMGLWVFVKKR